MSIPTHTLTLKVYQPDNVTLVDGSWRFWYETHDGIAINDLGHGLAGPYVEATASGVMVQAFPDTTNAGFDPQGAFMRGAFTSTDRRVRIKTEAFLMDADKTFADLTVVSTGTVTPSLLAQAQVARDAAATSATAAGTSATAAAASAASIGSAGYTRAGVSETVTGNWNFTGTPTLNGTPLGSGGGSTNASLLSSGTLPAARIADASIADAKLASGTSLTAAERAKLTGIATGATANSSDATLLARGNHIGLQAQSTVTNLVTDLAAKAATVGQDVAPFTAAELVNRVNTTYPIGSLGGLIYGSRSEDSKLYTTTDQGRTWTLWNNNVVGTGSAVLAIWQLDDGEVLVCARADGLYRSSGWAANHLTATWTRAFQPSTSAWVLPWHVSVSGSQVVVGEYAIPKGPADKLAISTDMGLTFTTRYSLNTTYAGNQTYIDNTHWHAATIDPYVGSAGAHRIWACYGDGPHAIIYTDDNGLTWTTYFSYVGTTYVGPTSLSAISADGVQPTTLTAVPEGIVLGTDRVPDGHQLIDRAGVFWQTYTLRSTQASLFGFANRTIVAPGGELYSAWTTSVNGLDVPITAVTPDGRRGTEVYTVPGVAGFATNIDRLCIDSAGWLLADVTVGGVSKVLRAKVNGVGSPSMDRLNSGGVFGGRSASPRDIAVGAASKASGGSVAVGTGTDGGTDRGVAVGNLAAATGSRSTAVGEEASAPATFSTSVGYAAGVGSGTSSVSVGRSAVPYTAGAANFVAVGDSSKATSTGAAVGQGAEARVTGGVALGQLAIVDTTHTDSVALGRTATTTAATQVQLGAKHIEVAEITAPAAPAADKARVYAVDSTGVTRLAYRTSAGTYTLAHDADLAAEVTRATGIEAGLQSQITSGITFSGEQSFTAVDVTGLAGATTATRYVGGTTGGPPTSGTFAAGDFVLTTLGNLWVCTAGGTPGTWVPVGANLFARKTGDTSRTATTFLADPDLTLPIVANAVYTWEVFLTYDGSLTGDIAIGFTGLPTGSTMVGGSDALTNSATTASSSPKFSVISTTNGGNAGGASFGSLGVGTKSSYIAKGTLVTGANAGSITVGWGQAVLDASNATTVFAQSYLDVKRRA